MKAKEYIEMLKTENTEDSTKELYAEVIECLEKCFSGDIETFEIKDTSLSCKDLYDAISKYARKNCLQCVSSATAAKIFAEMFNVKTEIAEKPKTNTVNLEDFF